MFWIIWRSRGRTKYINTVRIGTCCFLFPFDFRNLLRCHHTFMLSKLSAIWRCTERCGSRLCCGGVSNCFTKIYPFPAGGWKAVSLCGLGHMYLQWTLSTDITDFKSTLNWIAPKQNILPIVPRTMSLAWWDLPQDSRKKTLLRDIT